MPTRREVRVRRRPTASAALSAAAAAVLAACTGLPSGAATRAATASQEADAPAPASAPAATAAAPLVPGGDLPPGFDLARIEAILTDMPPAIDWAAVDPDPAIPTPASVLGHEIGARFTRHHQLVDWCERLAAASPRVSLERYGTSNQGRPLLVLVITAPRNHDRLDEILAANRRLTDPAGLTDAARQQIVEDNPAVSWLSYNVHGNEASCVEAAIVVSHRLAAGRIDEIDRMLEDTVVVIDPCLNPDGHDRYVSFFQQHVGAVEDPFPLAAEHREPWPSGRANHYLFDLNRDWVWGTQVESRQRLPIYRRFAPQLHVDVHEQGINSPYFLGAGDTPYHAEIPPASRDWFEVYGRVMGDAFDAARFVYATRERFDYLYPGYGKVLPVHHGAVGLLLEQAGHGRAGRAITVDDEHGEGHVLTLRDRAEHHATASLAAAYGTAMLRQPQLERFAEYFRSAMTPAEGAPTAWAIRPQADPRPRADLADLCALHGIELRRLRSDQRIAGGETFHPPFDPGGDTVLPAGTWIVPSGQPMGRLARILLERDPFIEDRDTYDITAWSVAPMFGLDAVAIDTPLDELDTEPVAASAAATVAPAPAADPDGVALLVSADRHAFTRVLSEAARRRVYGRLLSADLLTADGTVVPQGSLLLHTVRNRPQDLEAIAAVAAAHGVPATTLDGSIPAAGPTLGNNSNRRFIAPRRIVVASHSPISSLSVGHLRHMLEHRAGVPHSVVRAEDLDRLDLARVDVIVIPSVGSLDSVLGENGVEAMRDWVRGGGSVVAIGSASNWAGRVLVGADSAVDDDAAEDSDDLADVPGDELQSLSFAERQRRGVERRVPGAILSATVDGTHPLTAGVADHLAFHVFGDTPMATRGGTYVMARFGEIDEAGGPRIAGVAGPRALRRLAGTAAVTHDAVGRGVVIRFASDPNNRGINRAGMDFLARTILLAPSYASGRQPLGDEDEHAGG
jgi:hypothetical protein